MDVDTLRNLLGDAYARLILVNHPDTSAEQKEFFMLTIQECKDAFIKNADEELSSLAKKTDWTIREELEKLIKKWQN